VYRKDERVRDGGKDERGSGLARSLNKSPVPEDARKARNFAAVSLPRSRARILTLQLLSTPQTAL